MFLSASARLSQIQNKKYEKQTIRTASLATFKITDLVQRTRGYQVTKLSHSRASHQIRILNHPGKWFLNYYWPPLDIFAVCCLPDWCCDKLFFILITSNTTPDTSLPWTGPVTRGLSCPSPLQVLHPSFNLDIYLIWSIRSNVNIWVWVVWWWCGTGWAKM